MRTAMLLLAAIGCGSSAPKTASPTGSPGPGTASASVVPEAGARSSDRGISHLSSADGDGARATAVAMTYIRAITARKWNDACAARVARERKELADVEGSCEAALRGLFNNRPAAFANLDVGDVRRRGDQIAVDLMKPGQDQPVETLFLEREGASWQVTDLDDRYAF